MTWTFTPALINDVTVAGQLMAVRTLVGDTQEDEPLISNEEIEWTIRRWFPIEGTVEYCASVVADLIANKFAREVTHSADGVSINLGQLTQQFRDLAASLREQHKRIAAVGAFPDAGGMTYGETRHPGVRNFSFGTQMHDNIEAGQQDHGSRDDTYFTEEDRYF